MLSYIKGTILSKQEGYLIVENNNIGYKVFVGCQIWQNAKAGDLAELFLYHHIREDQNSLFGFRDGNELAFFELLLTVSGIGPKTALSVFDGDLNNVRSAIVSGDSQLLRQVAGVGPKIAERIVLELKNKISGDLSVLHSNKQVLDEDEALQALLALGYNRLQAQEALASVDKALASPERLKLALKNLR